MDEKALRRELRAAAIDGRWVNLANEEDRTVPASLLKELLTVEAKDAHPLHSLKLQGAIVDGPLDFNCCRILAPLCMKECEIPERASLREARGAGFLFEHCEFARLDGSQLVVRGDLDMTGCKVREGVDLSHARIDGRLVLNGADLHGSPALRAEGIVVEKSALFRLDRERGFKADGGVLLTDGSIGGIYFNGAELIGAEGGSALVADRLRVVGSAHARKIRAKGEIKFIGATVQGQFTLSGSTLVGTNGRALAIDGIEVARDLYISALSDAEAVIEGEVSVVGAKVGGQLSLHGAKLTNAGGIALSADGIDIAQDLICRTVGKTGVSVKGEVSLTGAHVGGQVDFAGVTFDAGDGKVALGGNNLIVDQAFYFHDEEEIRSTIKGEVRLLDSTVGGSLSIRSSSFQGQGGNAFVGDRMTVNGGVTWTESELEGQCTIAGARIRGQLTFIGCTLEASEAFALNAEGIDVGQGMYFGVGEKPRVETTGTVSLVGARVGGQLVIAFARMKAEDIALAADRVEVDGDMFIHGAKLKGEARFANAHVTGRLEIADVEIRGKTSPSLCASSIRIDAECGIRATVDGDVELDGARVDGPLKCQLDLAGGRIALDMTDASFGLLQVALQHGDAVLDLRRSVTGTLHRLSGADGLPPRTFLEGFVYRSLTPPDRTKKEVESRLKWIAADPDGYSSHPYEQLREIYRATGFEDGARRVGIFSQQQRRRQLNLAGKTGSRFLGAVVAHGYRPSQALAWLAALVLVGCVLFGCVFTTGVAGSDADLTALKPPNQQAALQPIAYTVDLLIPGIGLDQQSAWDAHGMARFIGLALTAAGWLLTAAILAGISIRRQ